MRKENQWRWKELKNRRWKKFQIRKNERSREILSVMKGVYSRA